MPNLSKLADPQVHEALLQAEVAAWLHDIGKMCIVHIESHTQGGTRRWSNDFAYKAISDNPSSVIRLSPNAANLRKPDSLNGVLNVTSPKAADYLPANAKAFLEQNLLYLCNESYSIAELIMLGTPGFATHQNRPNLLDGKDGWIASVLGLCHNIAHHDKQEPPRGKGQQLWPKVFISTAFGYEKNIVDIDPTSPNNLDNQLSRLPLSSTGQLNKSQIVSIAEHLKNGLGDTRRPINEVTLFDWGISVAALFKAAIATCILESLPRQIRQWKSWRDKIIDHDIAWRLLSIRTDGLEYLFGTTSIPDLLARKDLLTDGWNRIQTLLEETYPLGLEVYRDENGAVFVVPDIQNLTGAATDAQGKTLREYILETFLQGTVQNNPCLSIQGEIVPQLYLDPRPWKGQPAPQELPPIGEHVKKAPPLTSDPIRVRQFWCTQQGDICTVCGLRPQGPSSKAKERNVCDICEQRRADRSREWAREKLHTTIWTDEVADVNGRLALVVGQFDLTHWLSGDLVRTLAVRDPVNVSNKTADAVAKNPSFARLRRIWETTRAFWQEVAPTGEDTSIAASLSGKWVGQPEPRLEIKGVLHPAKTGDTLGPYHTYELILGHGVKLSAVWDENNRRFITCDNLQYLAGEGQLGKPVKEVLKAGRTVVIEEPVGYGARNKKWGTITLAQDARKIQDITYAPVIPILAEPRTFMALVPADKALDVVQAIKAKYEREMGKVRNRLPLHLGVVYAHRRLPLRAMLDAGRRMLKQNTLADGWRVAEVHSRAVNNGDTLPNRFQDDAQGQFAAWYEVDLEKDDRQLTWYVPAVMGDGQTEDHWYPYVFLASPNEPTGRHRYFKTDTGNPWNPDHPWLVHAGELQPGDSVYFTPATLDFIWLDAGGRRFEVAYDGQGRRRGLPRRPYLLDELDTLDAIWETLRTHLTNNQIYALNELIEKRREEWQLRKDDATTDAQDQTETSTDADGKEAKQHNTQEDDPTFLRFCRDALANAAWRPRPWNNDREVWSDRWARYAARGMLADVVELHMAIMKENAITESTPQETAQ